MPPLLHGQAIVEFFLLVGGHELGCWQGQLESEPLRVVQHWLTFGASVYSPRTVPVLQTAPQLHVSDSEEQATLSRTLATVTLRRRGLIPTSFSGSTSHWAASWAVDLNLMTWMPARRQSTRSTCWPAPHSQPRRRVGHPQDHSPQGELRLYHFHRQTSVVLSILLAMEAEGLVTLRGCLSILLLVLA